MKAVWKGDSEPLGLTNGKEYEILSTEWDGKMYNVVDETGDAYLYPADRFEVAVNQMVLHAYYAHNIHNSIDF